MSCLSNAVSSATCIPLPLRHAEDASQSTHRVVAVRAKKKEMGVVSIRHSAVEHRRVNRGRGPLGLVCEGETVGTIGEVDEMCERELALVVSVRCGKE